MLFLPALAGALGLGTKATAVLGGVVGLGSTVAKKRSAEKASARATDYRHLRNAAIAGGFNPLTVLQNGGANALAASAAPLLAKGDAISDMLKDGAESLFNAPDLAQQRERRKIETDLLKVELEQKKKDLAGLTAKNFGYSIPALVKGSVGRSSKGVSDAQSSRLDTYHPLSSRDHRGVDLVLGLPREGAGVSLGKMGVLYSDPETSTTEHVENLHGDAAAVPYSVYSVFSAVGHTAKNYQELKQRERDALFAGAVATGVWPPQLKRLNPRVRPDNLGKVMRTPSRVRYRNSVHQLSRLKP